MSRGIATALCSLLLLVLGAGAALACDFPSWLRVVGPLAADGTVRLEGGGFEAGATTFVWDRSDGVVVGETVVGEDGRVDLRILAPETTGVHKIIALTPDAGTSPAHPHAWTQFALPAAASATPAVQQAPARAATPPALGAAVETTAQPGAGWVLGVLVVLLAAGGGVLVRRRRPVRAAVTPAGPAHTGAGDAELQRHS